MHRNSFYNKIEEAILPALLQQVTDRFSFHGKDVNFIEVGANDGINASKTIDFIRRHRWRGVAVEPVPSVFQQLKNNLAEYENRVAVLNAAVGDSKGVIPFYQVIGKGEKQGDVWLPMLSSFDRNVILKQSHSFPGIDSYIEQIEVQSTTLSQICQDYAFGHLDILITDAEGSDDRIVKTLDFLRYHPAMINIEHIHIAPDRLRDLDAMLTREGYQRCIMWMDTAWFAGEILDDECVSRMIRTLPTLIPDYDAIFGNGYWLNHYQQNDKSGEV